MDTVQPIEEGRVTSSDILFIKTKTYLILKYIKTEKSSILSQELKPNWKFCFQNDWNINVI